MSVEPEALLSITQLAERLSQVLGVKVHPDRIRRRIKMGLPKVTDRCTGYARFRLSDVLAWWFPASSPKAS